MEIGALCSRCAVNMSCDAGESFSSLAMMDSTRRGAIHSFMKFGMRGSILDYGLAQVRI